MFHFIYPSDYFNHHEVDESFNDEMQTLKSGGHTISLLNTDNIDNPITEDLSGKLIVYRGWMLKLEDYFTFCRNVINAGGTLLTNPFQYQTSHHLPYWYVKIPHLTAETKVFPVCVDLECKLMELGWDSFFLKDYVKSIKTEKGSIIHNVEDTDEFIEEFIRIKGVVEGGFCIRRVEEYVPNSEIRYFVLKGEIHSPNGKIPNIVKECSRYIINPFYTIDVARRVDGVDRVIEVGDGQVSDLVGWNIQQFLKIF